MSSKEKGIQSIEATPHGYVVIAANGSTLLKSGTPAFETMKSIEKMALYKHAHANHQRTIASNQLLIDTAFATPKESSLPSLLGRLKAFAQGRKEAPKAITVIKGPEEAKIPPVLGSARVAAPTSYPSALAAALANRAAPSAASSAAPQRQANQGDALTLHNWELKRGRDGHLYASGVVHGYPHFPDGCTVETPRLGVYHSDTNSFEVTHSREKITLGMVKPGEEAKQSALMQHARKQVAVIAPTSPLPASLCVDAVQVKWGRARVHLSDQTVITSELNHPIGLAVRNLAYDLTVAQFPVEWGLPENLPDVELAKEAAAAAQASQPAPSTPAAAGPAQGPNEAKQASSEQQDPVPEEFVQEAPIPGAPADESFETSAPPGNLAQPPNNPAYGMGAIDKLYAPSDASGVDCHKITVKTGSVDATANITKEQYDSLKPLVDAGLTSFQACMQLNVQNGSWTFNHLVDRTGEALTRTELDSLRAEAKTRLDAKAATKPASPIIIPGATGELRIPGFSHLPAPKAPTPKTPEPGL